MALSHIGPKRDCTFDAINHYTTITANQPDDIYLD